MTDKKGRFILDNLPPGNYSVFLRQEKGEPDWVAIPKRVEGLEEGKQVGCPDLVLTKGGFVTGKVIDQETKRPLDGVNINAYPVKGHGGATLTTTKSDGTYRLRLPPGKWRVQVSGREGYLSPWGLGWEEQQKFHRDVEVVLGKTVTNINFTLLKAAEIKGIVIDPEGKPVAKAIVKRLWSEVMAKEDGTFALGDLKPDEPITLYAFSPDCSLGAMMDVIPKRKQTEPLTIKLAPCAKVTGKVMDEKGQPLKGASVRAERQVPYLAGIAFIPIHTAITDDEGRFTLKLPSGVEYNLKASAKGYGETQIAKFLAEGEKDAGALALKKADAFIAGRVTDPEGKPIQGARIFVYGEGQPEERARDLLTDAQGHYRVENLAPGKVNISVSYRNLHDWRSNVPTGSTDVDFILVPEEKPIPKQKLKPGDVAPEIIVARWLNGREIKGIRALKGKVVLVQFACPYNPAVEESNKHLTELHKKYALKGLVILAIYDASLPAEEVAKYAKGQRLPYPVGIVPETPQLGWNSSAFKNYGVQSVPSLFLIDRKGRVRLVNPSFGELAKTLPTLLGRR